MKSTEKPRYNMWQNTAFMIRTAWKACRSVFFFLVCIALVTTGTSLIELLIAPMILRKVETSAPLPELLLTIFLFSAALLIFQALKAYLNTNANYGRMEIRTHVLLQVAAKVSRTSYPNTLDTRFINYQNKAFDACSGNDEATEQIWRTLTGILINALGFASYLILLSDLNPLLILTILITAISGYFVNKRANERRYLYREEAVSYQTKFRYLHRVCTDRSYAKDIRIFGMKNWIDEVWDRTYRLYRSFISKQERAYLWYDGANLLLVLARNGIAYAYLLWLALTEGLSASSFLLYFTAASGFTQWILGILDQFQELHHESLDLSMVREFLEWPEPFLFEQGKPLPREKAAGYEIRLEDVSFRYPQASSYTIRHLCLTIRSGEKLAIVGLNGAGKTTLMKLICGFLDPTEGRVLLNGQDIRQYNRRDYYALFSAVFQDFSLLEASIAVNVAQKTADIDKRKVWQCLEQAGLKETILSLPKGVDSHLGRKVHLDGIELSGGETQRLMLARALYKNGPILALDEPTAALDPIAENDIYMKYNEMTRGKTSLFISHRLASTRFCDRILFIENGQIAEEGTHQTLLALDGGYAKLFEVQSRYYRKGDECHV